MDHRKFLHLYESNELALEVDANRAVKVALSKPVGGPNYPLFLFFALLWVSALAAAAPLFIWSAWWLGGIAALLVIILPRPIRRMAVQGVRHRAMHDPAFFEASLEDELVRVIPYP
ncbi:MAG: hypothetical protein R3360_00355 [Alphaproteobacteria bacterium]|nr:hypothetical protein [Alphaproteobacteria bacterium]